MRTLALLLAVACGAPAPTAATPPAAEVQAPAPPAPTFPEVSAAELQALVASGQVVVIDANGSALFKEGHIPGALDFEALGATLPERLPADKGALVVSYCGGPYCDAWKAAAEAVAKLGYTQVKHFPGGFVGWKEAGGAVEL